MLRSRLNLFASALMLAGCDGAFATEATEPGVGYEQPGGAPHLDASVKFWEDNAAVYWDEVARTFVAQNNFNAFQAIRGYAILGVAQYNAATAAERQKKRNLHPSVRAAISGASVAALAYLFPSQSSQLESMLDAFLAKDAFPGSEHEDPVTGETLGREVGGLVVERAKTDRFFDPWTGTIPVGPGYWTTATTPTGAGFGQARTYLLVSSDQFRPAPPPAFGSPEFVAATAEVRKISDTRTAEQDALAKFWNLPPGTYTPPGYWNEEATKLAVKYRLGERATAHLLALMNIVSFDAVVASHEAKYHYWLLRPSQADPGITLPIGLPNFPSYPSNHAAISAGMARILGAQFPAEKRRLDRLADEAALSRVYGGIHYRCDGVAGLELGRKIAAWALAHDVKGFGAF